MNINLFKRTNMCKNLIINKIHYYPRRKNIIMVELIGAGLAAGLAAVGAGIGKRIFYSVNLSKVYLANRIRIKIKI